METQKSKFIFINQVTGYLFIDIINAFAEDHTCELFAGSVDPVKVPLDAAVKKRLFTRYNRNVPYKRIYTWMMFTVRVFFRLLFTSKTTELFIVSNPPFGPFLGYFFNKLRGIKYHLLIYDVYPDVLIQFGMAKKEGFINKIWSRINTHLFQNASTLYTLSNNMAALIRSYAKVNVEVIPNWTDTSFMRPMQKVNNSFANQYHQTNKITIMYSGNMGATHAVEKIAELATFFKNDPTFGFIAIGDGAKRTLIQKMKEERQLNNLLLLPYQPAGVLPFSLACADIGIVTLSSGAEDLSVPSKTYNLLAAGVALLVIASDKSELANLVTAHNCGVVFQENELDQIIGFLKKITAEPHKLKELKLNARKASYNFTPANAYQYKSLLNSNINVSKVVEACK